MSGQEPVTPTESEALAKLGWDLPAGSAINPPVVGDGRSVAIGAYRAGHRDGTSAERQRLAGLDELGDRTTPPQPRVYREGDPEPGPDAKRRAGAESAGGVR